MPVRSYPGLYQKTDKMSVSAIMRLEHGGKSYDGIKDDKEDILSNQDHKCQNHEYLAHLVW